MIDGNAWHEDVDVPEPLVEVIGSAAWLVQVIGSAASLVEEPSGRKKGLA